MSEALNTHSVATVDDSGTAPYTLLLTAVQARTKCVPLGCTHNLRIHVRVSDVELGKTVWTASFLVGKPFAEKSDEKTLQHFAGILVDELNGDELI